MNAGQKLATAKHRGAARYRPHSAPGDMPAAVLIRGRHFAPEIEHNALVFVAPARGSFFDDLWIIELLGNDIVVRAMALPGGGISICQDGSTSRPVWQDVTRAEWFTLNPREILGVLNPRNLEFGELMQDRFVSAHGRSPMAS